jgi:prepilin-type N-terminal cleavage/methylation domain-containing protein
MAQVRCWRRGFTLIELLAVVAIVGILMGALFPAIASSVRSSKRHRSQWQFLEIKSALESYRIYYGNYPEFLSTYEQPIAINDCRDALKEALEGGYSTPYNLNNIRFIEFSPKLFNDQKNFVDQFGNTNIYIVLRHPDKLEIPVACFPESIRKLISTNGLKEPAAIYSVSKKSGEEVVSW